MGIVYPLRTGEPELDPDVGYRHAAVGGEHVTGGRVAGIASSFRPSSVEGNAVPMKTLKGFLCRSQDCDANSETDGDKASDESRIFEPEVWQ